MQIPETPAHIQDLDLMQRLAAYGSGAASYLADGRPLGVEAQTSCKLLHANLVSLDRTLAPLLAKVTAREMSTFTAHDPQHARKVAHLMWHITAPARRDRLTPPEIGLLIAAAYIHDLGMFLSPDERELRLAPGSDLWDCLEVDPATRTRLDQLATAIAEEEEKKQKLPPGSPEITAASQRQAQLSRQLYQAQEALLCADNRSRHALPERYASIVQELRAVHAKEPATIVSPDAALAFQGDSFLHQLLDICVSHNEAAHALVTRHPQHADRPRFARDFPVGSTTADLQFVAAALRLADILDFDRERTPPVLFHYFIPGALVPTEDDRSALEWSKHLAITHWHLDEAKNEIIFRARCHSHIVHHGIVHFCAIIGTEITETLATFSAAEEGTHFALPTTVRADIHAEGYTYVPYRFELDDDRIYRLLMGGSIYDNPLHAIRELIQNAVDACLYRDAHEQLHNPASTPRTDNRITITYTEPTDECPYPTLDVADTGSGMDEHTLKNYFLKVGRSFYNSPELNQFRVQLRKEGSHDFAPVSEFGIGFLSSFLLADKVEVTTALWKPLHGDTQKRTLEIHGPTRLMRLRTETNNGARSFSGTSVRLTLTKGAKPEEGGPATWDKIQEYLAYTCICLPYRLVYRHIANDGVLEISSLDPLPLSVRLPADYVPHAVRIPVDDPVMGLQGEIVFWHRDKIDAHEREKYPDLPLFIRDDEEEHVSLDSESCLIRSGFRVGEVPGMPRSAYFAAASAIISLGWRFRNDRRYILTNLSRTALVEEKCVKNAVLRSWFPWLVANVDNLPPGLLRGQGFPPGDEWKKTGIERFSAFQIYKLAANSWHADLQSTGFTSKDILDWEDSIGSPLPYKPQSIGMHVELLQLILPKVCEPLMTEEDGWYWSPPKRGWKNTLNEWFDYLTTPPPQSKFFRYTGKIKNYLYYLSEHLNLKHQNRIEEVFSKEEIVPLMRALDTLMRTAIDEPHSISAQRLAMLHKAQRHFGDLSVGIYGGSWKLSSFSLPQLPVQTSLP